MHKLSRIEKLKFLIKKAEAKKSNFSVASIVVDNEGNEYSGVNIEYEIPTNSICAERNAISTAITKGMKIGNLKEVHIYAENFNDVLSEDFFVLPCGVCRQVIYEASKGIVKIFSYNLNGDVKQYSINDLFPNPFKKSSNI